MLEAKLLELKVTLFGLIGIGIGIGLAALFG